MVRFLEDGKPVSRSTIREAAHNELFGKSWQVFHVETTSRSTVSNTESAPKGQTTSAKTTAYTP